jgi:hypothetical protein
MPAKKPASSPEADLQKQLLAMLERRHPEYASNLANWNFLEATYKGGREWFSEENIFKYLKEGDTEFAKRLTRAYRFNHTREVVDLVQKYIFKSPVTRNEADAPTEVKEFWKNATLSGLDIKQFMNIVSTQSSILGMPWVFVDTNKVEDVISIADAKAKKARAYAYVVKPQDILDVGFDDQGDVNWVLVRETRREDSDPILSSGDVFYQYRLWQRHSWQLFEIKEDSSAGKAKDKRVVELVDTDANPLGRVPGFPVAHVIGENRYTAPALINDIAYLDRAVANYLSNLDAIIQDQTFSQLAMPAQSLMPGTSEYDAVITAGTKRVFTYDGEGGAAPEFLSPDPKQAHVILAVVNKIINEIYHTIGMSGERTKEDNAMGIDNSSGVAKAYDFERMNSLLVSKAASLENCENKLVELVCSWNKATQPKDELVKYPETFDVRSLFDEFTVAEKLALVDAPDVLRREQMKQVMDKLFPRLAEDLKKAMLAELESWPPEVSLDGLAGKNPTKFPRKEGRAKAVAEKRQGQVTDKTEKK